MKYRVHFEASAAIGVEVEIEAEDESEAQDIAQRLYDKRKLNLSDIVEELLKPTEEAVKGFAEASKQPITYVTVEEDENGFEIVDVFEPEDI